MDVDKILICRLCLEMCKSGVEVITDITKEILNFLLPNLDLDICKEPVMCNNCINSLKECFNFKMGLHKIGDTLIKTEKVEVQMPNAHLCEKVGVASEIFGSNKVCYSCLALVNRETSVVLSRERRNMTIMLEKHFPELVLNGTVNSMCVECYKSLQNQLAFITNCLTVEEKINEYCKAEGTDNHSQVELSNILHFMSKSQLQSNVYGSFIAVKMEEGCEETENEDKSKIKNEDLIGIEETGMYCIEKGHIDLKQDDDGSDAFESVHENNSLTQNSAREVTLFKCAMCTYQSKRRRDLSRHMITHKNPSEVTMYKCEICKHESKHKGNLTVHMLSHKDPSEVIMYKCEVCTYQSRYKYELSRHMVTHKNSSEIKMYKCELCAYQSKRKNYLSSHMLSHRHISEVPVYKCSICTYQSKRKCDLSNHMLTHKCLSEVEVYSCKMCAFETKYRRSLQRHTLFTHEPDQKVLQK